MPITSTTSNPSSKKPFLSLVYPISVKVVKPKSFRLTNEEIRLLESFRATAANARFVTLNVSKRAAESSPCASLSAPTAFPESLPALTSAEARILRVFRRGTNDAQDIVLSFAEKFMARFPRRAAIPLHLV